MSAATKEGGKSPKDPKGLYSILGVPTNVDEAELRKAYRRLALRWHPDKNPDDPSATEMFQKISGAYEVLSDQQRRQMYDSTGCVDAEELEEADLSHATDFFAAFFGGSFGGFGDEDLDEDEQAMLDEFLRLAGGSAFKRGRRGRRKKGRGARSRATGSAGSDAHLNDMLEEMMAAAMGPGGMATGEPEPVCCPQGHTLKRKKADGEYMCDVCEKDILEGRRLYDCRKCDFCMCAKCHKAAEEQMQEELDGMAELDDADAEQLVDAFLEATISPVRVGGRLQFRCGICNKSMRTEEAAAKHALEQHEEQLQAFLEEHMDMFVPPMMPGMMGGMPGMPGMPGMHGMRGMREEDLAAMMFMDMDGLFGGGAEARPSSSRSGPRKPRKRR